VTIKEFLVRQTYSNLYPKFLVSNLMKLITLNTWGGVVYEPLAEFIKKHSVDTDIFCFQEVFPSSGVKRASLGEIRPKLFSDIQTILTDFNGYHAQAQESDVGGLAIFINKSFIISKIEHIVTFSMQGAIIDRNHPDYFSMGRDFQRLEFNHSGKTYSILNFHGLWDGKGKSDTVKRIEQSEKVRKLFDESKGARILCGDFNLEPDTKSIDILSKGNRNLIKEYKITSTRSSFYPKSIKFADYMIVSPEVEVKDFKVIQDKVSDHLPLCLEFS
jgi:endonuclease/exonuclease/phosphatase family metal-dependent hydrolase